MRHVREVDGSALLFELFFLVLRFRICGALEQKCICDIIATLGLDILRFVLLHLHTITDGMFFVLDFFLFAWRHCTCKHLNVALSGLRGSL